MKKLAAFCIFVFTIASFANTQDMVEVPPNSGLFYGLFMGPVSGSMISDFSLTFQQELTMLMGAYLGEGLAIAVTPSFSNYSASSSLVGSIARYGYSIGVGLYYIGSVLIFGADVPLATKYLTYTPMDSPEPSESVITISDRLKVNFSFGWYGRILEFANNTNKVAAMLLVSMLSNEGEMSYSFGIQVGIFR